MGKALNKKMQKHKVRNSVKIEAIQEFNTEVRIKKIENLLTTVTMHFSVIHEGVPCPLGPETCTKFINLLKGFSLQDRAFKFSHHILSCYIGHIK